MEAYRHSVQYYETDKMGITHHSNYIRWMEEARIDFFRQIGLSYEKLEAEGIISPVTGINGKFREATTFPDEVFIGVRVLEFKGVVLKLGYTMTNTAGKTVFEGVSEHCFFERCREAAATGPGVSRDRRAADKAGGRGDGAEPVSSDQILRSQADNIMGSNAIMNVRNAPGAGEKGISKAVFPILGPVLGAACLIMGGAFITGFSKTADRTEGSGYDSAEEAVKAYLDYLKAGDLDGARQSLVLSYDSDFSRNLNIESRRAYIVNGISSQLMSIAFVTSGEDEIVDAAMATGTRSEIIRTAEMVADEVKWNEL